MSRTLKTLEDHYIKGSGYALKLLGCCFIELLAERIGADFKSKRNFLLVEVCDNAPQGYGDELTWRRWRDPKDSSNPFLGSYLKLTPNAYKWAKQKGYISKDEWEIFTLIFNLLVKPITVRTELDNWGGYDVLLNDILNLFGDFEFKVGYQNGTDIGYFVHRGIDYAVNSVTLRIAKPYKSIKELSPKEYATLQLARKLDFLFNQLSGIHDSALIESSYQFLGLAKIGVERDNICLTYPQLRKLGTSEFFRDLMVDQIMEEAKLSIERLIAVLGKEGAQKQVSILSKYCKDVELNPNETIKNNEK